MPLDERAVDRLALLARLEVSPEERSALAADLSRIVEAVDTLAALDLQGVEPTTHPIPIENVLRDDEPRRSLARERVLGGAPSADDRGFIVPGVLDGGDS